MKPAKEPPRGRAVTEASRRNPAAWTSLKQASLLTDTSTKELTRLASEGFIRFTTANDGLVLLLLSDLEGAVKNGVITTGGAA
jgi:hypothetical protein